MPRGKKKLTNPTLVFAEALVAKVQAHEALEKAIDALSDADCERIGLTDIAKRFRLRRSQEPAQVEAPPWEELPVDENLSTEGIEVVEDQHATT